MALIDNLVSYWKLDESSDGSGAVTREDAHGTNDLTDNGTTASATGIISNGANFVLADTTYLSITDAAQTGLDFGTGAFSYSLWLKRGVTGATERILAKDDAALGYGYTIIFLSNNTLRSSANSSAGTQQTATSGTITDTTTFHHIVFTRGATNGVRIYIDGSADVTEASSNYDVSTDDPFALGARVGDASRFTGVIDEVGIWNRELTSTEVTELYNSGDGLTYPFEGGGAVSPIPTLSLLGVG